MASGPFVCCRELLPPSCLEHCVFAQLWADRSGLPQLVAASVGQVYIYSQVRGKQGKVLLKLEWSSRVYGSVEGLFVIPQKSRAEDTLLFVFDEGKMCLCSFDRQRMQLVTLKLWNAEEHAIGLGSDYVGDSRGRNTPLGAGRTPLTAVSSRGLACTLLYGHQLLFYPTQLAASSNSSQFSLKPLLVNLEDIGLPGAVIDICFVEGYLMPAVAILQELGGGLPVGHLARVTSSCCVNMLAVDVIARETRILWTKAGLPHNSCRLISVSDPLQHHMHLRAASKPAVQRHSSADAGSDSDVRADADADASEDATGLLAEYATHALAFTSDVSDEHIALPRQVLVITSNAVLLLDSTEVLGIATNGFAALTVDMSKIPLQPAPRSACVELDAARWVVQRTHPPRLLGVLNDGKMIAVDVLLSPDGLQRLTRFSVEELAQTVKTSCLCGFGVRSAPATTGSQIELLFIGSRSHDSMLVQLEFPHPGANGVADALDAGAPSKRARRQSEDAKDTTGELSLEALEEKELYDAVYSIDGDALSTKPSEAHRPPLWDQLTFRILDVIPTLGPVSKCRFSPLSIDEITADSLRWDLSQATAHSSVSSEGRRPDMKGRPADARSSLVVLSGDAVETSMHVLNRGIRGRLLASRELVDVIGITCCPIKDLGISYIFLSTLHGTRALTVSEAAVERSHVKRPSTREQKDNVIHILDAKEIDLESVGLAKSEVTLAAGVVLGRLMVQVCPTAIRVIDVVTGTPIQDMAVDDDVDVGGLGAPAGTAVAKADITQHGELFLILSSREVRLLRYSEDDQAFVISEFRTRGLVTCGSVIRDSCVFSDVALAAAAQSKPTYETTNTENGEFIPQELAGQDFTEEEAVLYGVPLNTDLSSMMPITTTPASDESKDEHEQSLGAEGFSMRLRSQQAPDESEAEPESQEGSRLFSVVVSADSRLEIYDAADEGRLVFVNADIGVAPPILENQLHSQTESTPNQCAQVKQISILRLTERVAGHCFAALALVAVYETNEFVLYRASEDEHGVRCWVKVEHEVISRPRREQVRDLRRRSRGGEEFSTWGHGVQVQTFSDSTRNGWLISGSVSAIVSLRKGYPTVLPFHPNRLPRKRDFTICLSPLRTTSCTAIAALEKSLRSRHGVKEPQLSTYLRIYEADISGKVHPLVPTQLGGCQIRLNTTARHMVELRPLTDDATQKQILATPTFAFATYRPVPVEFEAELEREQMAFAQPEEFPDVQLHDRFFDAQNSFALPDPVVGPTPLMFEDQYSVVLVQEGKVIDRFELNKHEHVIDMEQLSLEVPSSEPPAETPRDASKKEPMQPPPSKSNRRVLLAVSTGHIDPHGEDTQGEGRLLVFDIDFAHYQEEVEQDAEPESAAESGAAAGAVPMQLEAPVGADAGDAGADASAGTAAATVNAAAAAAVPGGGGGEDVDLEGADGGGAQIPATTTHVESELGTGRRLMSVMQPKLRLLWSGFGPSTVVRQFQQYVLSTVGCTLFVYWYDGTGLEQVSFFRAQYYIVDIKVVRNFIVIADIYRSVQFLTWREQDKSLTLLAKDYEPCAITTIDILVEMPRMAIVTCDNNRNVKLLQYDPRRAVESKKGFRLLCTGDFHIGHRAASIVPHQTANVSLEAGDKKQTCVVFGTMEGGVALMVPIEERTHRRFALLQHILAMALMHTCSLNPREYRLYKSPTFRVENKRGVLDANLLWRYVHLDFRQREEIAEVMGTSVDTIIDSLLELDLITQVF